MCRRLRSEVLDLLIGSGRRAIQHVLHLGELNSHLTGGRVSHRIPLTARPRLVGQSQSAVKVLEVQGAVLELNELLLAEVLLERLVREDGRARRLVLVEVEEVTEEVISRLATSWVDTPPL